MNKINKLFLLTLGLIINLPSVQIQAVVNPMQLENDEHNYFQNLRDDDNGQKAQKELYKKILIIPGMIDNKIGSVLSHNGNPKYVEVANLSGAIQNAIAAALSHNGNPKYVEVANLSGAIQNAIATALSHNGNPKYVEVANLSGAIQNAITAALTHNGNPKYVQPQEVQNLQQGAVQNAVQQAITTSLNSNANGSIGKAIADAISGVSNNNTTSQFNVWHHLGTGVVTLILAVSAQAGITYYLSKNQQSTEGQTDQGGEQSIVS